MELDKEIKEYYEIVGEFVSKVNSIEFFINTFLERIILNYKDVLEIQEVVEATIDHIEEQSLRTRINMIILFLVMTKGDEKSIQEVVVELKNFSKYYNKKIRDIRDFIAHNPLMKTTDYLVISSRRYKGKLNSIKISDLKQQIVDLNPKIVQLHNLIEKVSSYNANIVRDFS